MHQKIIMIRNQVYLVGEGKGVFVFVLILFVVRFPTPLYKVYILDTKC